MAVSLRRGITALIRISTSAADNPPSGQRVMYPKVDGWYERDVAGVERPLGTKVTAGTTPPAGTPNPGEIYLHINGAVIDVYRGT